MFARIPGDKIKQRITSMKLLGFLVVGFACAAVTFGQAAVEYSVGAGAATGAAAGAKGAGQSVGGVFGAVGQILNQAPKPGAPTSAEPGTAAKTYSIPTKPIDPSQVAVGMDRNELLDRFGEPATRTSQTRRSQMLDTFWYSTITKDELIVSLTDGKVVSTVLASQRKRSQTAALKK